MTGAPPASDSGPRAAAGAIERSVMPLAREHVASLLSLFETASSGCFCRFWHFSGEDNAWLARCATGAENRADFRAAALGGDDGPLGVVAVEGGGVVGWLKLSWAPALHKLASRRVYRTLAHFAEPRPRTLVVGCMLVEPQRRHRGVARDLLGGAIAAAGALGANAVEAFPRVAQHALRDDELQMGPRTLFDEHGFVVVDGPEPYPVMRLELVAS